jgi:hypothetical protein
MSEGVEAALWAFTLAALFSVFLGLARVLTGIVDSVFETLRMCC